jgi:hypothetical protein
LAALTLIRQQVLDESFGKFSSQCAIQKS